MPTTPIDGHRIKKFLEGTASPEEIAEVMTWLKREDADLRTLKSYMEEQWDGGLAAIDSDTDHRMLSLLQERLYPGLPASATHHIRRVHRWGRYAVAACLVPLIFWAGYSLYKVSSANNIARQAMPWKSLSNSSRQTRQYNLPDGSFAWLSPNSQLSYPAAFGEKDREIRLSGESFLDITPDPAHPFIVHAGNIRTTVLGTAFNVEAYEGEKTVRISLVKGKVAVQKETDHPAAPQILAPGELLSWERNTDRMQKGQLPDTNIDLWTKGYMIFNDVPLADALQRVARRYHLRVQYAAGLQAVEQRITTILKDDPLEELTQLLPFVAPYRCSVQNQILYVTKN